MRAFTGECFSDTIVALKNNKKFVKQRLRTMESFNQCIVSKTRFIAISLLVAILFSIGAKFSVSSSGQQTQIFNQVCTVSGIQAFDARAVTALGSDESGDILAERPCEFCFSQTI